MAVEERVVYTLLQGQDLIRRATAPPETGLRERPCSADLELYADMAI